jgi:hypothetical protein
MKQDYRQTEVLAALRTPRTVKQIMGATGRSYVSVTNALRRMRKRGTAHVVGGSQRPGFVWSSTAPETVHVHRGSVGVWAGLL